MKANEERQYDVELKKCIFPDCGGELYELVYDEHNNWIIAVYKCAKCGREFTAKIEL